MVLEDEGSRGERFQYFAKLNCEKRFMFRQGDEVQLRFEARSLELASAIAAKTVPLSKTMKEQISHIRGWAFERAVRASPPKNT